MTAKPGQKTLASLDEYRYGAALNTFGSGNPDVAMGLEDVKTLVEWKLYVAFQGFSSSRFLDVIPLVSTPGPWHADRRRTAKYYFAICRAYRTTALIISLPPSHQLADLLSVDTGSLGPP